MCRMPVPGGHGLVARSLLREDAYRAIRDAIVEGTLAPGADADVVLWDPALTTTATAENRHGNADYTPYEGMTFHGGPAAVYVRGNPVYKDGEIVGERGSGRFVERSLALPESLGPVTA